MAHLHLPAQHSDDDLAIAGALAQVLGSGELYVAWSTAGGAGEPVVPAQLHTPDPPPRTEAQGAVPRRAGVLARLLAGLRRTA